VDAFISPAGTGLVYTGSSARISYALGRNGYIPEGFNRLNDRDVPWIGIVFAFAVGMIVFLPFPGWQKLVAFITSASLIIYAAQCASVAALRAQLPDAERPLRIPALRLLAPLGFVVANLIVLFSGWDTYWKLLVALGIGFALLAVSNAFRPRDERPPLDLRSGAWLAPWVLGLGVISYLSSFNGQDTLHFGVDMIVCAAWSLVIYAAALRLRLTDATAQRYFDAAAEEAGDAEPTSH
jgi:amino acid transporter